MTASRALDRELLGCWVLKANPDIWDYHRALKDEGVSPNTKRPSDWTVGATYRKDLMAKGDLMVLMVTGSRSPGIYEIGHLTGSVFPSQGWDPEYVVDERAERNARWAVAYEAVPLKTPLPREVLRSDPALSQSEPFRAPRMSNPTFFSSTEVKALGPLLEGHVTKSAALSVGWSKVLP